MVTRDTTNSLDGAVDHNNPTGYSRLDQTLYGGLEFSKVVVVRLKSSEYPQCLYGPGKRLEEKGFKGSGLEYIGLPFWERKRRYGNAVIFDSILEFHPRLKSGFERNPHHTLPPYYGISPVYKVYVGARPLDKELDKNLERHNGLMVIDEDVKGLLNQRVDALLKELGDVFNVICDYE